MRVPNCLPVIMLALTIACGDGITGPEACQTLPALTIYTGSSETVTPCFTSAAEGDIAYAASSADADIADVEQRGTRLVVTAFSPGETEITVTATDANGSTTVSFDVLVPNRDPEVSGTAPTDLRVGRGESQDYDLASLFSDPDGQTLTYTAEVSPAGVVNATLDGSVMTIEGIADGEAAITITASDDFTSVSVSMRVTVITLNVIYEDDFDSGNLNGWAPWEHGGSRVRAVQGNLEVWGTGTRAIALRSTPADNFNISARIRPGRDSVGVGIGAAVGHASRGQIIVVVKTYGSTDFEVIYFGGSHYLDWTSGSFDMGSSDEYVDFRWWYEDNRYHLTLNGSTFSFGDAGTTTGRLGTLAFVADATWAGLPNRRVYMDRIQVAGDVPGRRIPGRPWRQPESPERR